MKKRAPVANSWLCSFVKQLFVVFSLMALVGLGGCKTAKVATTRQQQPVFMETESGLKYYIVPEGHGPFAADGDVVAVHYKGKLEDGSVFDSSRERGEPISFTLGKGQVIPGWEEAIKMLRQGDKGVFKIPPHLAYGESGVGPIPPNATIIFDVELVGISNPTAPFNVKGVALQTLPSGVEYAIVRAGEGIKLEPGMRLKVHYNGFLEDGTLFDSSFERGQPIEFVLGRGMVIPGWEQGLAQLRVGDRARIWIPYQMAYGESGRGPIPARANLVFDVEVMDAQKIEPPKPFNVEGLPVVTTDSGLKYIIVSEGTGPKPQPGKMLLVHYSGYLEDGTLFDSSLQRGEPFRFILGANQVIKGWDEGFSHLTKGSKARFIIPPHLGYGEREVGPIPASSTLAFDVELIDFQQ